MPKLGIENLQDNIVELLNKTEDLSGLETNNKSSLVAAINEVAMLLDANNNSEVENRELLSNTIGNPITSEDSIPQMCAKLNTMLAKFKENLSIVGSTTTDEDKFDACINKIKNLNVLTGIVPGNETLVFSSGSINLNPEYDYTPIENAFKYSFNNIYYSGTFRIILSMEQKYPMEVVLYNKTYDGDIISSQTITLGQEWGDSLTKKTVHADMKVEKNTKVDVHFRRVPSSGISTGESIKLIEVKCNINFSGKN